MLNLLTSMTANDGFEMMSALAIATHWLRTFFGVALVLVLPGAAITAALFPRRTLDWPERLLFILVGSISVTAVGSLGLYLSGWPLSLVPWATLLGTVTAVATIAAWLRRRQTAAPTPAHTRAGVKIYQVLLMLLACGVVGIAIFITYQPAPSQGLLGYSALWVEPVTAELPATTRFGVTSGEFANTAYRAQIIQGEQVLHEWTDIELKPGGQWVVTVTLPTQPQDAASIEVLLFRADQPDTIYRHITLWQGNQGEATHDFTNLTSQ
ncbi:MAG: DUF1616 domain-containing protein [Caldilineaceae bacterium]